jgi:hypothetical protein
MAGKRHTTEEIAVKLSEADALRRKGRSQQEIARVLGITVMTYHRWRKKRPLLPNLAQVDSATSGQVTVLRRTAAVSRIQELESENARLRRLVMDLLLEKMRLEEDREDRRKTG